MAGKRKRTRRSTDSLASPESKLKRSHPTTSPQNSPTTAEPSFPTPKTLSTHQEDAAIDTAAQPPPTSGTTIYLESAPRRRTRKTFATERSDFGQRRTKRLVSPNRTISPQSRDAVTQALWSSGSRDQDHTEKKGGHVVDIRPSVPSSSAPSVSKHRSEPSKSRTLASESSLDVEDQIHFTVGASASKRRRRDRQRSVVCSAAAHSVYTKSVCEKPPGPASSNSGCQTLDIGLRSLDALSEGAPADRTPPVLSVTMLSGSDGTGGTDAGHLKSAIQQPPVTQFASTNQPTYHDLRSRHHVAHPSSVYLLPSSVHPHPVVIDSDIHQASRGTSDPNSNVYIFANFPTQPTKSGQSGAFVQEADLPSSSQAQQQPQVLHPRPIDLTVPSCGLVPPFITHPLNSTHALPPSLLEASTVGLLTDQHPTAISYGSPTNFSNIQSAGLSASAWEKHLQCYQALRDASLVSTLIGHSGELVQTMDNATSDSPTVTTVNSSYQALTTNKSLPDSLPIPSSLSTTPISVTGSLHAPAQQPQQTLLSPISVARLISLNTTHSTTTSPGKPTTTGQPDLMYPPRPLPPSIPPSPISFTAGASSNKFSRYPAAVDMARHSVYWSARGSTSHHQQQQQRSAADRNSPHTQSSGINNRIAQLQQHRHDRSMQLIILQDINQVLLIGFEENLINLNVQGLVSCVLDILDCEGEHLIELKNLGCNVLTHMMDALPRSADAVVPALPLLLTTMSCSFVGDILERIINLLEQLSRRHGKEVLQSGAITSVLGFYDFVTLAQHRTILTMVSNCFANLQRSDFDLIVDCLPSLAERLKESEPRCVERVCTCFARLVTAYRTEPQLLKRIVSSCNLFTNLQYLLMASPPILSGVRDVVHILAILCASCPELAVDLIKQNIAATLHCILTGEPVDSDSLQNVLLQPVLPDCRRVATTNHMLDVLDTSKRHRSHSGSGRKRSTLTKMPETDVMESKQTNVAWFPFMLTMSPLSDSPTFPTNLVINKRSQDDIHSIVQLICELLPPVPPVYLSALSAPLPPLEQPVESFYLNQCGSLSSLSNLNSTGSVDPHSSLRRDDSGGLVHHSDRSSLCGVVGEEAKQQPLRRRRQRSGTSLSQRLSSTSSCGSSGTLRLASGRYLPVFPDGFDPRARLLQQECHKLFGQSELDTEISSPPRRRPSSVRQTTHSKHNHSPLSSTEHGQGLRLDRSMEAVQMIQILLPLLFELFTETTKLQTRLRCLEAIQRMLFFSCPVLLVKTLHPRVVCNHIVGMLNNPERRVLLSGLHIAIMLIDRVPPMFATYFRKEGILHQVDLLKTSLSIDYRTESRLSVHSSLQHLPGSTAEQQSVTTVHTETSAIVDGGPGHSSDLNNLLVPHLAFVDTQTNQFTNSTPYIRKPWRDTEEHFTSDTDLNIDNSVSIQGRRANSAVSAPVLLSCTDHFDKSPTSDEAMRFWIEAACHQLGFRVGTLMQQLHASDSLFYTNSPSHQPDVFSKVDHVNTPISYDLYLPSVDQSCAITSIDLMPTLSAIASHLSSNKPALWTFAFQQLVELLQPTRHSKSSNQPEPPSPFELHKSGVTAALLSYLTASDACEVRLWIIFRIFFGARSRSDVQLPPTCNLLNLNKKQSNAKNWPHLFPLTPVLLRTDKAEQLREVDCFIDRHVTDTVSLSSGGPSAFHVLLDCLLACFHRHEHFQVSSLPPTLPADSYLLSLLHTDSLSSDMSVEQTALSSNLAANKSVDFPLTNLTVSQKSLTSVSGRPSSRVRASRTHSSKVPESKPASLNEPSTGQRIGLVEPAPSLAASKVSSRPTHSPINFPIAATPGMVWIELVRLSDDDGQTDVSNCSTSRNVSGIFKSGRKSSSSSTSSNHSSTASTASIEFYPFEVPNRSTLQITALATFHIIERLLLQRNYINSLFHDGLWAPDHDYGLSSLAEAYSVHSPREDELRSLLDPRGFDDGDDDDDVEVDDEDGHHPFDEVRKTNESRRHREFTTHDQATLKRSHVVARVSTRSHAVSNRSHPHNPESTDHMCHGVNVGPTTTNVVPASLVRPTASTTEAIIDSSRLARYPDSSLYAVVSADGLQGSLQRELRSLLQREPDPMSNTDHRTSEKVDCDAPLQNAQSRAESWRLRRRSTTKSNISEQSWAHSSSPDPRCTLQATNDRSLFHTSQSSLLPSPHPPVSIIHTNNGSNPFLAEPAHHKPIVTVHPSATNSRHRRLKGSSILAAFGALANLSSSGSQQTGNLHKHHSSKHNKSVAPSSTTATTTITNQTTRRPVRNANPHCLFVSSSTSNASSSSMSPISMDDGGGGSSSDRRGRHRPTLVFYIGDHQLPPSLPLFEAIRKFSPEFQRSMAIIRASQRRPSSCALSEEDLLGGTASLTGREMEELAGHLMWSMTHLIHYRVVNAHAGNDPSAVVSTNPRKSDSQLFKGGAVISPVNKLTEIASSLSTTSLSTSSICSVSTFSSAMTCLKRRRSDEVESVPAEHVNKPESCHPSGGHSIPTSTHHHPLFSRLTHELPLGFLAEARCACGISQCCSAPELQSDTSENALSQTVSSTLALLRVLHTFSRLWYTMHDALDPFPIISPLAFRSSKLAIKANRQLQDAFSVLAGNLPAWLIQLISTCPFLFPFEIRRTFFYAYNFDRDRTLMRFQDTSTSSVSEIEQQIASGSRGSVTIHTSTSLYDVSLLSAASPNSASSTFGSGISQANTLVSSALNSVGSAYWPLAIAHTESLGHMIPDVTSASGHARTAMHRHAASRSRYHTRLALSPNLKRHKVTVHREGKRLLRQAEATLAELLDSRAVLEIAFDGEVGFGLGPTLEFYTLVSRQLMKSSYGLWHGNETTSDGYVIAPIPGLYPRPLSKQTRSTVFREIRSRFLFLGRLMARALLDWRQLDLPFSPAFFKWFLAATPLQAITEGHILLNDLALVDPELGRHLRQLAEMANRRHIFCRQLDQTHAANNAVAHPLSSAHLSPTIGSGGSGAVKPPQLHLSSNSKNVGSSRSHAHREHEELKAALAVLDNEIEDLCLNFVLPGYEIELLKNGSHIMVTGSNLGDYIRLVAHWLVIEGASRQMEAVVEGFDSVLPNVRSRLALIFQPDEMEGLFCGRSSSHFEALWSGSAVRSHIIQEESSVDEGWDVQNLTEACRCDHGYTPQSRTIRNLFEVMSGFTEEERRLFVQFVTGSPRLPVGGFRALKPPLKIVMKRESGENADNHLPSVMTCQNYLKLPDYSSKELLAAKLMYAIREGQNAFHLS
ncbi:E3 ubiquitin-protein ligase TRIP12 [Paragonimus westermani]|uniref:E3 ubiquitin-protein ligase n=1 Tax=Paragonimus westermani TaxID=34504 RepID=A0A5J4NUK0_9TREM|nr:E3 ubiquitin-protein ligase TRIP12 [Paragonimus westermani]